MPGFMKLPDNRLADEAGTTCDENLHAKETVTSCCRTADFQSAVSRICNRQGAGYLLARETWRCSAECNSALRAYAGGVTFHASRFALHRSARSSFPNSSRTSFTSGAMVARLNENLHPAVANSSGRGRDPPSASARW